MCHNCHEHDCQAEPQAMADPARCASEPMSYLRTSALTNTCEALAMYLPGTCAGRSSADKPKAVMLGGLVHSASQENNLLVPGEVLYRFDPWYFDMRKSPPQLQIDEKLYYEPCVYCGKASNDPLCMCATSASSRASTQVSP